MVNLKNIWYRLVANGLVKELERTKKDHGNLHDRYEMVVRDRDRISKENADLWERVSRDDAGLAVQMLKMRAEVGRELRGSLEIVRTQLRQELANSYYNDELLEHYAGDQASFNDIPEEDRRRYFAMVDKKLA